MTQTGTMQQPTDGDALCDYFDQFGPFAFELPSVETIMAKAWMFTVPTITQDDRDAAHDALVEIPRCEHCDAALRDEDLRAISGHANGCDVDETVFACLCGNAGVL